MDPSALALMHGSPASMALLALTVLASLAALTRWPGLLRRGVFRPYWLLRQRQWATPLTSALLHADLAHLLFNAFTFWAFAFGLERRIGTLRFLALYAAGVVVSSAGTWFKHRQDPGYQCLGASGAILAVLFASIVYFPAASLFILPIPVPIPAPLFALGYLGYSVWAARQAHGRINHDAHLWGALAGLGFVAATDPGALMAALRQVLG